MVRRRNAAPRMVDSLPSMHRLWLIFAQTATVAVANNGKLGMILVGTWYVSTLTGAGMSAESGVPTLTVIGPCVNPPPPAASFSSFTTWIAARVMFATTLP